jgi:hypothetical protein
MLATSWQHPTLAGMHKYHNILHTHATHFFLRMQQIPIGRKVRLETNPINCNTLAICLQQNTHLFIACITNISRMPNVS